MSSITAADRNTSRRTFGGAVLWSYVMNCAEKGLYALSTLVLAYVLGPSDFGTVAMAMVYVMFIQMFLDQGLAAALIQRKNLRPEHLDSVFWMVLVVGLMLVSVSVALSGWWARINHLPALAQVISVLSIAIPIESLAVVQKAILFRDLDFKRLTVRSNLAIVVAGLLGIGLALKGLGVWALVGQKLGEDIVALILLWNLSHWRPRLQFSARHVKELLSFASANFIAKLGDFVNVYSSAFLMGLLFGPLAVGLYRFAERLMTTVLLLGVTPLQTVAFPQFSRIQDNPSDLRRSVLACVRIGSTVTVPALAGLAVTSSPLMAVMGGKWTLATNVLKILCVLGIIQTFAQFTGPLLRALSRPRLFAALVWTECAVTTSLLLVMSLFLKAAPISRQLTGIAISRLLVGALVFAPILIFFMLRMVKISFTSFLSVVAPSLLAAGATAGVVAGLSASALLKGLRPVVSLSADVVAGGLSALVVLLIFDRQLKRDIAAFSSKVFRGETSARTGELLSEAPHAGSWKWPPSLGFSEPIRGEPQNHGTGSNPGVTG